MKNDFYKIYKALNDSGVWDIREREGEVVDGTDATTVTEVEIIFETIPLSLKDVSIVKKILNPGDSDADVDADEEKEEEEEGAAGGPSAKANKITDDWNRYFKKEYSVLCKRPYLRAFALKVL